MSGLQEGSVETNGLRLHYLRVGNAGGNPSLVLAHGFSDSGACWASLIRVLARDWNVVAYDARGHGDSGAPDAGYSGEEQAEDLLGLLDALRLERPVLMGHSMGGETVGWAAAKRPGAIRALVLEDSGIPFPDSGAFGPEQRESLRKGLAAWVGSLQSRSIDDLIALTRETDPRWPEEDRRPWAEAKLKLSRAALEGFAMTERRDLVAQYPSIRCPVLFLKADAPADERARHREIVSRLTDGEIVHVEGAGHNVRRDEAALTAYHLGRFLARV
jgi:pimeloyl-ACP methyl ester carboxylesterase